MFETALRALPRQDTLLYLQENIAWEFGMLWAWRSAGHGRVIGVPHSTVRYWDLRYFYDPRAYEDGGSNGLPVPDKVAVNGPEALRQYSEGGYPRSALVEVEALRYVHYGTEQTPPSAEPHPALALILLEYVPAQAHSVLAMVEAAVTRIPQRFELVVKPHPSCPFDPTRYRSIQMRITDSLLPQLLDQSRFVVTGQITSAALDAYLVGLPVIVTLDPEGLNLSPLRGREDVWFVDSAEKLADAMLAAVSERRRPRSEDSYFHLERGLPRWLRLFETHGEEPEATVGDS